MRVIERSARFRKDYKREIRTDAALGEKLVVVLTLLANDAILPERLSDHPMSGSWKGFRDCHIKPDLVLIYAKSGGLLSLARLGSHSELFG